LGEVELGNAPPIEYVIKNIHIDEAQIKAKAPISVKDVVEETRNKLDHDEQRLRQLQEEHLANLKLIEKTEYKPL